MVSVQRSPTVSYVVLPEGTRRSSVFTVHETGAPVLRGTKPADLPVEQPAKFYGARVARAGR
jgi:hypothetical protein